MFNKFKIAYFLILFILLSQILYGYEYNSKDSQIVISRPHLTEVLTIINNS